MIADIRTGPNSIELSKLKERSMRNIDWNRAKTSNMPEWLIEDEMSDIFGETLRAYKDFLGGEFLE
tara:strand:- start:431 stop:628 length:198 start_codon:yes stop_codon:yes gene_type:complete